MRSTLALALALACLSGAVPAAAQVVTLRGFPGPGLTQGPELYGERVAWSQTLCVRGCGAVAGNGSSRFEILAAARGRPAERLFRARLVFGSSGPDSFFESYAFLLSEHILVTMHETFRGAEADIDSFATAELRAGPARTPRERLLACRSGSFQGSAPFALDQSRLAYDPDPCDGAARIVVRDLANGTTQPLPDPAGGAHLRLRGRFAAWIAGAQLVVHDVISGLTEYTAPAPDTAALDLDLDGTAAACSAGRLLRYSAAAPGPVDLGAASCPTGVRIDAGRIAFLASDGFTRTLRLRRPNDSTQDLVRFGRVDPGQFDLEGERLAWAARDCGGGEAIFTATLAEAPQDAGSINCRARFRSGTVHVRRGVATVRLRCPRGCGGELSLRHMGTRAFSLLRGESEVRIRLPARARERLRRRGTLEALAKLVTRNRAGDRHARSRAVTLVAR